ncbi:MAG: hypothetical protein ACJ8DZ_14160 [Allosphingosinicella sp.]
MSSNAPKRPLTGGSIPKTREDDARGAPPGRFGNPPFVPSDSQRLRVRALAKTFPPTAEHYIARLLGINLSTLRRHFGDDLEMGRAELLAAVGSQLINAALDKGAETAKGDRDLQKFIMARLAGWSNKHELSGLGGGPIETVDLSRLTPDQLEQYGRLAAIAVGVDPDQIIAVPRD